MNKLSLLSSTDVQTSMQKWLIEQRKSQKLSRNQVSEISTVPASTIKKFEVTGQISLRQFLLLWQSLDNLERLQVLTEQPRQSEYHPRSIKEVLKG